MRWNILSLATGVSICRDCAADLHISEYELRMWGKRYDQLWPRVKLATSARVGFFCNVFNHLPYYHTHGPTLLLAICLQQFSKSSWYHVIKAYNLTAELCVLYDIKAQRRTFHWSHQVFHRLRKVAWDESSVRSADGVEKAENTVEQRVACVKSWTVQCWVWTTFDSSPRAFIPSLKLMQLDPCICICICIVFQLLLTVRHALSFHLSSWCNHTF